MGPTELIIAAIVVLVLFGGRKIPELARGLGQSIRELKGAVGEGTPEPERTPGA